MSNMKCLGSGFLVNVTVDYEIVTGEINVISGTEPNMFFHFPTDSPEVQEGHEQ